MYDPDKPVIIIQLEGDDFYAVIDYGAGEDPRYGLSDAVDNDNDRFSNDRASLIRTAVRRIDQRVAALRAALRAGVRDA
jgi:hypothetical protein